MAQAEMSGCGGDTSAWVRVGLGGLAVALAVTLAAAGCGRATAALERGMALEEEGIPLQAAASYIEALERDSSLEEAERRLAALAPILADVWQKDAAQSSGTSAALHMAEQTLLFSDLLQRSAALGLDVAPPEQWAQAREEVLARGVEAALAQSQAEAGKGDWAEGVRLLDRAAEYYEPSPEQTGRLRERHLDHRLAWGEAEIAQGRHRSGYNRLDDVRSGLAPQDPRQDNARLLQERAVREGAIRVAFLPVHATDRVNDGSHVDLARRLDQELQIDFWPRTSSFIRPERPSDVRREMERLRAQLVRSSGEDSDLLTLAVEVGRSLSSARVVVVEVEELQRDTTSLRQAQRTSTLRGSGQEIWAERSGVIRMRTRFSFFVMDPATRLRASSGSISARATTELNDAVYDGDWGGLDLTTRERILFTGIDQLARELEAEDALLKEAAEQIASRVEDQLLRGVP